MIAKAHELGLMNIHIPEEYGGPGLSVFDGHAHRRGALLGLRRHRRLDRRQLLGAAPVVIAGTDEQKREWLPPLIE